MGRRAGDNTLIRCGAMCQMSFHEGDFCRALSQLVHCPLLRLLDCLLVPSGIFFTHISFMTLCSPSAFDHHFVTDGPNPLQSVSICPITSLILRHSLAWSMAMRTFPLLSVFMVGCTIFMTGSSESSDMQRSDFATFVFFQD